jgi:F420-dependent oxidoreductase-like protein
MRARRAPAREDHMPLKLAVSALAMGAKASIDVDLIRHAESLGFDSAWTAEAYGNDAVTTATWVLAHTTRMKVGTAIMQMPARTPAMAAMTAMTLDHLSGGRFILGLGPSGPQVVEGWHGMAYGRPLTRTREYIQIIRQIMAREAPVEFSGREYQIPYAGPGASGLGKPLKSILHGNPDLPIYTASISPAGLTCAAEVADGVFPFIMDPQRFDLMKPHLDKGFAVAGGGKSLADFKIIPGVSVVLDDDVDKARTPVKQHLALYIGGMGSREKNFYNDYAKRLGYEEAAGRVQDLFLGGKRAEAVAAVPDALVDAVALVGPSERIRDQLGPWRDAAARGEVDTVMVGSQRREALELMAEELL